MLRIDETIGGWTVRRLLGEGGMGAVYLCEKNDGSSTEAAVKVLKSHGLEEARERFMRELDTLRRLSHPGIVEVYDSGEQDGLLWMSMAYVEGRTLEELIKQGPMPVPEAVAIYEAIVEALAYAHSEGIRHRDIKPANVIVDPVGQPRLLDFGIAVQLGRTRLTQTGTVPGTMPYMPPEVFEQERPDPTLCDVYATGLLLCEMLTGDSPYPEDPNSSAGQRMARIMAAKLSGPAPDPGPGHPALLRQYVRWATARDPRSRVPSMPLLLKLLPLATSDRDTTLPPVERADGSLVEPPPLDPDESPAFSTEDTFSLDQSALPDPGVLDQPEAASPPPPPARTFLKEAFILGMVGLIGVVGLAAWWLWPEAEPEPEGPTMDEIAENLRLQGPGWVLEGLGIEMVKLEPGAFFMGANAGDPDANSDETSHPVTITRPFLIAERETPTDLFVALTKYDPVASNTFGDRRTPCTKWGHDANYPVTCLTFEEVLRALNLLSKREGLEPVYSWGDGRPIWNAEANGYRLPTEAEWEYAARAGTNHRFAGTDDVEAVCAFANVGTRTTKDAHKGWFDVLPFECDDGVLELGASGRKRPNAWGLHDMTGNVREWVWDRYGPYDPSMNEDPVGPAEGADRVVRGGSWADGVKDSRVVDRLPMDPLNRDPLVGFRIVRNAD